MSIEITDNMRTTFTTAHEAAIEEDGMYFKGDAAIRLDAALAAVLDLPEVRQAIHDDVRRELDAKLRALGVTGYSLEGI